LSPVVGRAFFPPYVVVTAFFFRFERLTQGHFPLFFIFLSPPPAPFNDSALAQITPKDVCIGHPQMVFSSFVGKNRLRGVGAPPPGIDLVFRGLLSFLFFPFPPFFLFFVERKRHPHRFSCCRGSPPPPSPSPCPLFPFPHTTLAVVLMAIRFLEENVSTPCPLSAPTLVSILFPCEQPRSSFVAFFSPTDFSSVADLFPTTPNGFVLPWTFFFFPAGVTRLVLGAFLPLWPGTPSLRWGTRLSTSVWFR